MNDTASKQQIVEKIKESSNILVTVSTDPSVDELSAALGLTLLLNKMNKHATAVFSGAIPPAITFLDPQKTFENTVDSLRDFIIALDKEKADHLRYKVDGDVVKIFITPYRTTISSDDLDFSQGDYNVEFVMALGVNNRDHLDSALEAHGRILHDATVATISVGEEKSELGSIDWSERGASSLSELLVGLSDMLKNDKPLLDEQIATAFLTGIVAATDRFSNNRTSSRVMTIAAQLMGAGANQQLIASKLEEAHEIGGGSTTSSSADSQNSDGTTNLSEGESTKVEKKNASRGKKSKGEPKKDDGSLTISHEKEGDVDEVAKQSAEESQQAATAAAKDQLDQRAKEVSAASQDSAAKAAEQKLATQLADVAPAAAAGATPSVADLQKDLAAASADVNEASNQEPPTVSSVTPDTGEPSMGGTLNATTEQAADDARRALEDDRNHTILTHGGNSYVGDSGPTFQSPLNAASQPSSEPPLVDPFAELPRPVETPQPSVPAPTPEPVLPVPEPTPAPQPSMPTLPESQTSHQPTLADIDQQNRAPHEEARAAVEAAFGAVPFNPSGNPQESVGAQPLGGAIQHDSPATPPSPPASTLPPLPDFSTLPPLPNAPEFAAPQNAAPPDKLEDVLSPAPAPTPTPQSNDPGQFKIPGQSQ
jgi:hypothetical protein